ncbi:MAG: hypothetical protein IPK13_01865 [Deltaproteobacteria bacterium]|nr:hypothetical protein [Deltaproteobacteria bacterium]
MMTRSRRLPAAPFAALGLLLMTACGAGGDAALEDADALSQDCSVRLYRMYSGSSADHFYTASYAEMKLAQNQFGYVLEDEDIFICSGSVEGVVPLYRYWGETAGDHFYTTRGGGRAIDGYVFEGVTGYVFPAKDDDRVRLHRWYSATDGDHFYTTLTGNPMGYVLEDEMIWVYPRAGLGPRGSVRPPTELPPEATDGGVVPSGEDAGTDSGTSPEDAGAPPYDAGTSPEDAGAPPYDAGTPPYDAGSPAYDAGAPAYDAGTPAYDAGPSYLDRLAAVRFVHRFEPGAGADPTQCNGRFSGTEEVVFGDWSKVIRIDADQRNGWCDQQFGLIDPLNALEGLRIRIDFYADGDPAQCKNPGSREIPIASAAGLLSSVYGIDTDGRFGGCQQEFSLEGRDDLALDVQFEADGDAGQCGNTGQHAVVSGTSVRLRLDTDHRAGGCRQRFRLRLR